MGNRVMWEILMRSFCTYFLFSSQIAIADDTIVQNQSISVGQTLVSSGQTFELGFFSTNNTKNLYFGIWYKNITPTYVWVANRNNPLTDSSGVLTIANDGNIVILNGSNSVIWSSNSSRSVEQPIVQLLESGNLVLKDRMLSDSEDYLWQSFDYPSDTMLPGMRHGWDQKTGLNRNVTSWKNMIDPAIGDYSYALDLAGLPQLVLRNGSMKQFQSGVWDGLRFSGLPNFRPNPVWNGNFVSNTDAVYYAYINKGKNNSPTTRLSVNEWGKIQRFRWDNQILKWIVMFELPRDHCDNYNWCGANGICDINISPACECLKGFIPKSQQQWDVFNWAGGCVRRTALECGVGEGFEPIKGVKLPDMVNFWVNKSMSLNECKVECMKNCSCTAYANSNITEGGSGCILWFGNLLDLRQFTDDGEQNLYIRSAASGQEPIHTTNKKKRQLLMTVLLSVGSAVLLFGLIICSIIWNKMRRKEGDSLSYYLPTGNHEEMQKEDLELPLLDLITIEIATNNFSHTNKIGEGGFGPVYKGKIAEGQEIAVKRLSKDSGQGLTEFKNEVILIAKLQHRNLVKLLGCCIQGEEKMLVYEYMPNESLDYFIFDRQRSKLLDWEKRLEIVMGIARGLLYLHQDSRLRIIHRDLKTSNILLDVNMIPKISDFGMARIFGGDQTEAKTKRVVGTYGYMSPEYAIDGHFSVKSDVFSFGVLVLEILSGKRNRGFYHDSHHHNLLGHAWILWKERKALQVMDPCLEDSHSVSSEVVLRRIQVGQLCVQQLPEDRPSMSSVVLMLGSENLVLQEPKQPGFFVERSSNGTSIGQAYSETQVTISLTLVQLRSLIYVLFSSKIRKKKISTQNTEVETGCKKKKKEFYYFSSPFSLWSLVSVFTVIFFRHHKRIESNSSPMDTKNNPWFFHSVLFFLFFFFSSKIHLTIAADTISVGQSITGDQTIISKGGVFELGFFTPGESLNYYIGIWYKKNSVQNSAVVWVANRDKPLSDPSSSELKLLENGNLVLLNQSKIPIWSTNSTSSTLNSSAAVLSDDGNLSLRDGLNSTVVIWQSFDNPTNIWLPGGKLGFNKRTNKTQLLTSWTNKEDPAPGIFSLELDSVVNQYLIKWNQSQVFWSSGEWNGTIFSLVPEMQVKNFFDFSYITNDDESYFTYSVFNKSLNFRFEMGLSGQLKQFLWSEDKQGWDIFWSRPTRQCGVYGICGAFGSCNQKISPSCNCLQGFKERSSKAWNLNDSTGGCVRKTPLKCGETASYSLMRNMIMPVSSQSLGVENLEECKSACSNICSCNAYAYGSDGCLLWDGDLLNVQQLSDGEAGGRDFYLRLDPIHDPKKKKGGVLMIVILSVGSAMLVVGLIIYFIIWKRRIKGGKRTYKPCEQSPKTSFVCDNEESQKEDLELPLLDLSTIETATNNFSHTNKIGEGGFGPVYKGRLPGGQEIAVKRLSKDSGQGLTEFKNEVILIAKLQHRNLVKILGCCIQGEERMLIYEYMANESLDYFIFDQKRSKLLGWEMRSGIVMGIARGLLYLHQDSRLRIIHRDLKASNILLDIDMNPKISDFGMARLFGGDQTEAKTRRVVGTYGYMSPEYAIDGHFSVKSDVFSFGVLVLEIISGKRNRGFYEDGHHHNLLGHAWMLWRDGKALELMDPCLEDSRSLSSEVQRYIQVGLLCVQQLPEDRPTMSSVVFMLGSENAVLPEPKEPGFFVGRNPTDTSSSREGNSENQVTITLMEAR
ncbi:Protein kinase domain [Macleaya cordata]|uniref:non-specific serine/threonine protein kinase n=1 Tax=Macleaya cordata TaxID=56857 RepID=A0A200Q4Y2_MACCD|nr:Protein kinase domain [Macleaya cordata]